MPTNHLESVIAEYYELQEYFVLRNIKISPRDGKGGYDSEIDILAYKPIAEEVIHIETSLDTDSWERRLERINNKFRHAEAYVERRFGKNVAKNMKHEFVLVYGAITDKNEFLEKKNAQIRLAEDVFKEIVEWVKREHPRNDRALIPEQYPNLRTIQFVNYYFKVEI